MCAFKNFVPENSETGVIKNIIKFEQTVKNSLFKNNTHITVPIKTKNTDDILYKVSLFSFALNLLHFALCTILAANNPVCMWCSSNLVGKQPRFTTPKQIPRFRKLLVHPQSEFLCNRTETTTF